MAIFIRANVIEDCGNGIYCIVLPSRELSQQDREALARLFPNMSNQVFELMEKEMLLASFATAEDIVKTANGQGKRVKKRKDLVEPMNELTELQNIFAFRMCSEFWERDYESMTLNAVVEDLQEKSEIEKDVQQMDKISRVISDIKKLIKTK